MSTSPWWREKCQLGVTNGSAPTRPTRTLQMSSRRVWAAPSRWSGHALLRLGRSRAALRLGPSGVDRCRGARCTPQRPERAVVRAACALDTTTRHQRTPSHAEAITLAKLVSAQSDQWLAGSGLTKNAGPCGRTPEPPRRAPVGVKARRRTAPKMHAPAARKRSGSAEIVERRCQMQSSPSRA